MIKYLIYQKMKKKFWEKHRVDGQGFLRNIARCFIVRQEIFKRYFKRYMEQISETQKTH